MCVLNVLSHYLMNFPLMVATLFYSNIALIYYSKVQRMSYKIVTIVVSLMFMHSIYENLFWQDLAVFDVLKDFNAFHLRDLLFFIVHVVIFYWVQF